MRNTRIVVGVVVVAALILAAYVALRRDAEKPCGMPSQHLEYAITSFAEVKLGWPDEGDLICTATILWEHDITDQEKIAYASTPCLRVIVKDGDLKSTSGSSGSHFFLLTRTDNAWQVSDWDERTISPNQETDKAWVLEYEKLLPKDIASTFDTLLEDERFVQKASAHLNTPTASYQFRECTASSACGQSEVCMRTTATTKRCVKQCSQQQECGVGYSCRFQCMNGENGCPDTKVAVCVPDVVAAELEKTGSPW